MSRYGAQFGPDITFLGIDRCDLDDPSTYEGADIVILGAPFDGGSNRRRPPGRRRSAAPTTCRTTARDQAWRYALTAWSTCGSWTPAT